MFGKKKQSSPAGRQRPLSGADGRGTAVFSYHSASRNAARPQGGNTRRDVYASARGQGAAAERLASMQGKRGVRRAAVVLGVVLITALALNSLVLDTRPRMEVAPGASATALLQDKTVYEQAAADLLGASLTNRVKLTAQTGVAASRLTKQFPELGAATILLPVLGRQPVLRVDPAVPALIMGDGSQSYVLSTAGRAILPTAKIANAGKLSLPVVTDQSGLPLRTGEQALPSSTVHFITEVAGQLKAAKAPVASMTLPKGMGELDVRLEGQPYFIKFNLMGNARAEAGAFLAVKQHLEREHKTPGSYIDVRVEGRVYYK